MRALLRLALAGCAALAAACGGLAVLGPTAPSDGIIVYIHANYAGTSQQLAVDVRDLGKVEGPCVWSDGESATATWDGCISSIRVMPGWRATLYRNRDFRGASFSITSDAPDLTRVPGPCSGTFNDCISSIQVSRQ